MNKKQLAWPIYAVSWLFAIVFLWTFFAHKGFPPACPVSECDWRFLFLSLLFSVLPFFSKIKIGKLVELERDLKKTREEFRDHREQTAQMLSVISTNVSSIANLQNTININIPGMQDLLTAKQKVDQQVQQRPSLHPDNIIAQLRGDDEDTAIALVKARVRLEGLLRDIMGKRAYTHAKEDRKVKYMGLYRLFSTFSKTFPQYRELMQPFAEINNVLNAATHAQRVPDSQAEAALDIAASLIAILEDIEKTNKAIGRDDE